MSFVSHDDSVFFFNAGRKGRRKEDERKGKKRMRKKNKEGEDDLSEMHINRHDGYWGKHQRGSTRPYIYCQTNSSSASSRALISLYTHILVVEATQMIGCVVSTVRSSSSTRKLFCCWHTFSSSSRISNSTGYTHSHSTQHRRTHSKLL